MGWAVHWRNAAMALGLWGALASQGLGWGETAPPMAVPVEGEPFVGRLLAIDSQAGLTFQTAQHDRHLAANELVVWGSCTEPDRGMLVVLGDGGLMIVESVWADRQTCRAESRLFGPVQLSRPSVAGVVFHPPTDRLGRDRLLDRVANRAGATDLALLLNGDELPGQIDQIVNGKVRMQSSVGPVELELRRVAALIHASQPAPPPTVPPTQGLHALLGFGDGTRLCVSGCVTAGDSVVMTLAWTPTLKARLDQLVFLQPITSQVVYLSDLKPQSYRHTPFLSMSWPYRADRNLMGGMLRAGGRTYLKGLGVHSASHLTYALAEPYRRFQAELAIDDLTRGGGSVVFRILVDGQLRYTSSVVRGAQAPVPVSVDLSGAKQLELVVEFADRADQLDHADWLAARLIR